MKLLHLSAIAATLLGLLCSVDGEQHMPSCAAQCLASSLDAQSVCAATNTTCICMDPALNVAIQGCVAQSCSIKETLIALNVTAASCGQPVRDRRHIMTFVALTTGGAALFVILLRLCNAIMSRTFGIDDAAAAAAGIVVIAINTLTCFLGPAGFGRDIWYLTPEQIYHSTKILFFCQLLVWPLSALTKMTFLLFYLRIFPQKGVRTAAFSLMGLTGLWFITFLVGNIFNCTPISYFWTGWDREHHGHCINQNTFIYVAAAFNISIDISCIVLPLTEIYKLHINNRKKLAIMLMFSVGIFTLVVAIIRLVSLTTYAKTTNPTYDTVFADVWTMVELNVGIFCACMPSIRHFFAHFFPRWFSTINRSSRAEHTPRSWPSSKPPGNSDGKGFSKAKLGGIRKTTTTTHMTTMDDEIELVHYAHVKRDIPPSTSSNETKDYSTRNGTSWTQRSARMLNHSRPEVSKP